jgi:hypothetical protein
VIAKEGASMTIRTFALIYGLVFTLAGIAGFVPALVTPHEGAGHALAIEQGAGDLLGLFPVNVLHNLVHIAFGVWGLAVYRNDRAAIGYARSVAVIYAVFVIMGFIPGLDTVFGLVPLHGNDLWLHAALAAVAAYFGFMWHEDPAPTNRPAARGT